MVGDAFVTHTELRSATRILAFPRSDSRMSAAEIATLLVAGTVAAAATGLLRTGFRIPGNSIVFAMVPMALGMALVPRRLAGVVMAGGAFAGAGALTLAGLGHYGSGAMTSLCLTGPMMDVALAAATAGWRVYLGLAAAGVASNLIAFLQRGAGKLLALDGYGMRPFADWWPQAVVTYLLSGGVAGLLAATLWFQLRRRPSRQGRVDGVAPGAKSDSTR